MSPDGPRTHGRGMQETVERPRTSAPVAAAVMAAFGLLVGAAWAWSPSVWFDEAATLSAVRRPLGELADLMARVDAVHGLYYVVAHAWTSLAGDSVTSLRLLSALGLGVAAALTVLLTDRLSTRATGWVAGGGVVLLPGVSWAGVEARSFAWSAVLAVLSTYLLVLARERGGGGRWVGYAVALAASNWLFLFAAPMVAVHAIALVVADRRLPRGWLAAAAGATAATVPLVVLAYGQREQIDHIHLSLGGVAVRVFGAQTFTGSGFNSYDSRVWMVPATVTAVLVTFVVLSGVVRRRPEPHDRLLLPLVWTWAVVPTLLIAGPRLWGAQFYEVRYLTYSVPAVAILVGVGLSTYAGVFRRALVAALVLAAVPTVLAHHLTGAKADEDYRGLAALAETWRADAVVFSGAGSRGIEIAYPAPFLETEDLILRWSATESDTLFGINVPARWIQPADVAGKAVLQYRMTDRRPDPYARRLHRLGCRVEASAIRWRFTAVLLRC